MVCVNGLLSQRSVALSIIHDDPIFSYHTVLHPAPVLYQGKRFKFVKVLHLLMLAAMLLLAQMAFTCAGTSRV